MATAFLKCEAGSGMVEFAIAAFLFTLLLLGIFEFGMAAWAKNGVASAARLGTRFAVVRGKDSGLAATTTAAMVQDTVRAKTTLSPITVNTVWADVDKKPDTKVTVTVSYNYKRVGLIIPNRTLTSTSSMYIIF